MMTMTLSPFPISYFIPSLKSRKHNGVGRTFLYVFNVNVILGMLRTEKFTRSKSKSSKNADDIFFFCCLKLPSKFDQFCEWMWIKLNINLPSTVPNKLFNFICSYHLSHFLRYFYFYFIQLFGSLKIHSIHSFIHGFSFHFSPMWWWCYPIKILLPRPYGIVNDQNLSVFIGGWTAEI